MSAVDKDIVLSVCANCGKEGDDINNLCNKCKQVKYCNAACKKKHRHKHKKDCEEHQRLAQERAVELHDEKLFAEPPSQEDCPICFLQLPSLPTERSYMSCCGKLICNGCRHAPLYDNQGNEVDGNKCVFCRTPHPETEEELIERIMKRVDLNDPIAISKRSNYYKDGTNGYPQDYVKALELYHRAGELGYSEAYGGIGWAYLHGRGVEVDKKRAIHYWELGAIGGDVSARHNLGLEEARAGNYDRAVKHYMIATRSGDADTLKKIQQLYLNGHATKEDYTKALQSYQKYLSEVKSPQRDKAAAFNDQYRD